METSNGFRPATWYIFELLEEGGRVVYVGFTKNPDQRLYQLTKLKPHSKHPNSSYGMFYGQNLILDVIAGFDTKAQALEALEILKEEQDPEYAQKKLFRKQICSNAGRLTIENGNHNMFARYQMPDGKIVTKIWLNRYCEKHGIDRNSAIRI